MWRHHLRWNRGIVSSFLAPSQWQRNLIPCMLCDVITCTEALEMGRHHLHWPRGNETSSLAHNVTSSLTPSKGILTPSFALVLANLTVMYDGSVALARWAGSVPLARCQKTYHAFCNQHFENLRLAFFMILLYSAIQAHWPWKYALYKFFMICVISCKFGLKIRASGKGRHLYSAWNVFFSEKKFINIHLFVFG